MTHTTHSASADSQNAAPSAATALPRPQDDFYRAINGEWLDTYQMPPDRSSYGAFNKLAEDSEAAVREILEDDVTPAPKSSIIYNSFMDTDALEKLGISPIQPALDAVSSAKDKSELVRVLGTLSPTGGPTFFEVAVYANPKDPSLNIAHIVQSGIGLPDEAYYRKDQYAPIRKAYVTMVAKFFRLAGIDSTDEASRTRAEGVLALETKIAKFHWDIVTDRDDYKIYNPMDWDEFEGLLPQLNLDAWADAWQAAYDKTQAAAEQPVNLRDVLSRVIVHEPSFLNGLDALWQSEPLDAWRNWAFAHVLIGNANALTKEFEDTSFDFYGRVLSGTSQIRDRWKRAVALVNSTTGEEVGKEYVRRHFPASSKQQMETLVANLINAYRVSISNSEWLGEETKKKALIKLDKFTPMIGYTEHWRDYTALHVDASKTLIENLAAATVYETGFQLSKAGKPVDRKEWLMNPQAVNAYYEPSMNVIVFPAAILQPPFFDPDADAATNYGAIGAVIGHEIGHGFDDQGSLYNGDGKLEDWWTDADRKNFEKLTKALIAQYDALVPEDIEAKYAAEGKADQAPHVNGALTIGENIGDLSGVNISLKAYVLSEGKKAASEEELETSLAASPVIDGNTAAQRFFLAYAEIWRTKEREELAEQYLAIDPHSPAEFRTNQILRNVTAFSVAYGTKPGDGMWLDPQERVHIW